MVDNAANVLSTHRVVFLVRSSKHRIRFSGNYVNNDQLLDRWVIHSSCPFNIIRKVHKLHKKFCSGGSRDLSTFLMFFIHIDYEVNIGDGVKTEKPFTSSLNIDSPLTVTPPFFTADTWISNLKTTKPLFSFSMFLPWPLDLLPR